MPDKLLSNSLWPERSIAGHQESVWPIYMTSTWWRHHKGDVTMAPRKNYLSLSLACYCGLGIEYQDWVFLRLDSYWHHTEIIFASVTLWHSNRLPLNTYWMFGAWKINIHATFFKLGWLVSSGPHLRSVNSGDTALTLRKYKPIYNHKV